MSTQQILSHITQILPEIITIILIFLGGFIGGFTYADRITGGKIAARAAIASFKSDVLSYCRFYIDLDVIFSAGILTFVSFLKNIGMASGSAESLLIFFMIIYSFILILVLIYYPSVIIVDHYKFQGFYPGTTRWSLTIKLFIASINIALAVTTFLI